MIFFFFWWNAAGFYESDILVSRSKEKYAFQKEKCELNRKTQVALFSAIALCSIECSCLNMPGTSFDPLIEDVNVTEAEKQLLAQIDANSAVCTSKLGCTHVLTDKVFLTQEMPLHPN